MTFLCVTHKYCVLHHPIKGQLGRGYCFSCGVKSCELLFVRLPIPYAWLDAGLLTCCFPVEFADSDRIKGGGRGCRLWQVHHRLSTPSTFELLVEEGG